MYRATSRWYCGLHCACHIASGTGKSSSSITNTRLNTDNSLLRQTSRVTWPCPLVLLFCLAAFATVAQMQETWR